MPITATTVRQHGITITKIRYRRHIGRMSPKLAARLAADLGLLFGLSEPH